MPAILFDLAGIDDRRFSPFCWRTRLAFAHKGVALETRPIGFTAINSNQIDNESRRTVPTIDVNGTLITGSNEIAEWLESEYAHKPSLFGGDHARQLTRFIEAWTDRVLHGAVARTVLLDIYEHINDEDKAYFRESREARFGQTLEQVQEGRDDRRKQFYQTLSPARAVLKQQNFLGGESPCYADYIMFGAFQWARTISSYPLLDADDAVMAWRDRVTGLYDGLANSLPHYD